MKYLDLRAFHEVEMALNFDNPECSIFGSCDAYTVKAAGTDKKLYKRIDQKLEEEHKKRLETADRLPHTQPSVQLHQQLLDRSSAFGDLGVVANRRKFAYLVATLNQTHYDYDFSSSARPDDFYQVTLQQFMLDFDQTMYNLRPHCHSGLLAGAQTPYGTPVWNPHMWTLIDSEMGLKNCEVYVWEPEEYPFEAEDAGIWAHHYLLYNHQKKRVCYLYIRADSAWSSSPAKATSLMDRIKEARSEPSVHAGASKRAGYWFGDLADLEDDAEAEGLDNMVIDHGDEVVDADEVLTRRDRDVSMDYYTSEDDYDSDVEYIRERELSAGRAPSEPFQRAIKV